MCDATQQCKALLGHVCTTFGDCASGHCADGVCCNSDCNGTCQQCNLAAKPGTCSPVPSGIEDPPTCASDDVMPRACDGTGTCAPGPRATGKPCTAGAQCSYQVLRRRLLLQRQLREHLLLVRQAGRGGSLLGDPAGTGRPQRHHHLRRPDEVLQRIGHVLDGQEAERPGVPRRQRRLRERLLRRRVLLQQHLPGDLPVVRRRRAAKGRASTPAPDSRIPPGDARAPAATTATGRLVRSGLKANGTACSAASQCGSGFCQDSVCCEEACTAGCYTCAVSGNGKRAGILPGRHRLERDHEVRGAELLYGAS